MGHLQPKRRVAFTSIGGKSWTGGALYLRNLLITLRALDEEERPHIILLLNHGEEPDDAVLPYIDLKLIIPARFSRRDLRSRIANGLARKVLRKNPFADYLKQQQVDCVFAPSNFGGSFNLPLVGWIPDFQHLHLPQMFNQEDIAARDANYHQIAAYADRVLLSSQDAQGDLARFAPQMAGKGKVVSFVAHVPVDVYDSDPQWVCQHYDLPERFYYLPNQFWKHKNHSIIIEALSLAVASDPDITVVCTGNTSDERNPTYFAKLLTDISEAKVRNNLILLGMVPHGHIFSLMRQSVAILQPSLFEGWSTTVEEAKSIGKSIILSDIAVHREQNPPSATYFSPQDAEGLASCLLKAFRGKRPGPDLELERDASQQLHQRDIACARSFLVAINEAIAARS